MMTYDAPYTSSRREFTKLTDPQIDQLFYLAPIYQTLFDTIRNMGNESWFTKERTFLDADNHERAEWIFASRMLASHGSSIPQIDYLINSVPPALQMEELKEKRNELIMRLAGTKAGKHWMKCMKMSEGWGYVARFLCGGNSGLSSDDVDEFLLTLDQIAIMHDLIKGRGKKYGFKFNPISDHSVDAIKQYCHKSENARKILTVLHEHIDKATTPKRASRPIRAMMEAGALTERLPWKVYEKEFGSEHNDDSSYNTYTNTEKPNPFEDSLYKQMVEDFRELS